MFVISKRQMEKLDEEWRKTSALRLKAAVQKDGRYAALNMPDAEVENVIKLTMDAARHMRLPWESDTLRLLKLVLFYPGVYASDVRGQYVRRLLIDDENNDALTSLRMAELAMSDRSFTNG